MSVSSSQQIFNAILGVSGPVLFIGLQLSCLAVAFDIYNMKSVKKLSSIPFASLMANGVLWTEYGVLKSDNTIFIPNVISLVTAAVCMGVYYKYAIVKPVLIYLCVALLALVGAYLAASRNTSAIGILGCALSVMMSGSPLAVINTVIKEKSTASLPFWTSFVTWLNTLSWVLYGSIVAHDNMIIMPNSLGLALATLQMCLFALYGMGTGGKSAPAKSSAAGVADSLLGGNSLSGSTDEYENPYNV